MRTHVKVYLAKKMSGRTGAELVRDSFYAAQVCPPEVELYDPVTIEGVTADNHVVSASEDALRQHWKRDKEAIRDAHVLIDTTGPEKSAGVEHECGYARYALWKPVVRVWPHRTTSITILEDDVVVDTLAQAYEEVLKRWGTRRQRIVWRLKMLNRCLLRWFSHQINEFK